MIEGVGNFLDPMVGSVRTRFGAGFELGSLYAPHISVARLNKREAI